MKEMEVMADIYEQARKDVAQYDLYVSEYELFDPPMRPKTFKEKFGYEIYINPLKFIGDRFDK